MGGTREQPQPYAENRIGKVHIGSVGGGGQWGAGFTDFMLGRTVADIYAAHGLCHVQDMI